MSVASIHAAEFFEKVARDGRVHTFLSDGQFLVFAVQGREVVPFWSSRSRLLRVQELHPKYRAWKASELGLGAFVDVVLPTLASGDIRVGLNWAGKELLGYDRSPAAVEHELSTWRARLSA